MNNYENIIYPEELIEMASVWSVYDDTYYNRLLAVNPDINRNGAYFKYYKLDTYGKPDVNRVARINFFKPEYIIHNREQNGIPTWKYPNSSDLDRLVDILNSPSDENTNYTVWTVLKYHWNHELRFKGSLDDYTKGIMDNAYANVDTKHRYVPYSLQMPDYRSL